MIKRLQYLNRLWTTKKRIWPNLKVLEKELPHQNLYLITDISFRSMKRQRWANKKIHIFLFLMISKSWHNSWRNILQTIKSRATIVQIWDDHQKSLSHQSAQNQVKIKVNSSNMVTNLKVNHYSSKVIKEKQQLIKQQKSIKKWGHCKKLQQKWINWRQM